MANTRKSTRRDTESSRVRMLQDQIEALRERVNALTPKHHLFELIEQNFPDVFWTLDLDLNRTYISPSVWMQRGIHPEEIVETSLYKSLPLSSIETIRRSLNERLKKWQLDPTSVRDPFQFELDIHHAAGHALQCEVTAIFDLDESDRPIGIIGITRDISARKRAEAALVESEERYRVLFSDTLEALSLVQKGLIFDVNATWLALHGYESKDPVIGKPVIDFIHPLDRNAFLARKNTIPAPNEPRICTIRDCRSDGSPVWVEVLSNTIHIQSEMTIVSAIRDISGKIKAEEKLTDANRLLSQKAAELETLNEELTRYSYAVSHELKNPLRAIRNYAIFLREELPKELSDKAIHYFNEMNRAINESRRMVESILELSKVGQYRMNIEPIDLGSLFQSMIASIETSDVSFNLPDQWPEFRSERILLLQIFSNLIQNAIKFNRSERKEVIISWKKQSDNQIVISVKDNGIGIPDRCVSRIFDAFERLNPQTEFEGSGMGLAIVRKAVLKLGGRISVRSAPDTGSTFQVTLPISASDLESFNPIGKTGESDKDPLQGQQG